MTVVSGVLAGVAVLVAVLAALATRVPTLERPARVGVLVVEALVAFFVVADLGLLLRAGDRPESWVTHAGYAVASVGLIPTVALRRPEVEPGGEAGDEPEPPSLWVVVVTLLAVAVCVLRLVQTR